MIPFRPTVDRAWTALTTLKYEYRSTDEYVWHMHPSLLYDLVLERKAGWSVERTESGYRLFGLPVECDSRIKRGYIHLRHEVVA